MAINQDRARDSQEEKRQPEQNEFIPQPGKTCILRFLPRNIDEYERPEGADDIGLKYKFHYNYTRRDGSIAYNIPCPKTYNKKCRICEEGYRYYKSSDEAEKKLSNALYRKERALMNLFDLSSTESEAKGVQWWRAPIKKVYQEVMKFLLTPAWNTPKDIFDLVAGKNFQLEVISEKQSGTGFQDYVLTPIPNAFDISPYLLGDWRARINSLTTHMPQDISEAEMEKLLEGNKAAPASPSPAPASSGPAAPPVSNTNNASAPAVPPPPVSPAPAAAAPAAPAPAAQAPAPAAQAPAAAAQPPAPPDVGAKPECFGKKYLPKEQKCKDCKASSQETYNGCRKVFLDMKQ